jgi:hypothetical protein
LDADGLSGLRAGSDAPHFLRFTFLLFLRKKICGSALCAEPSGNAETVSKNHYHAREAAAALLRMAKATSDRAVAAGLVEAAAKLKDEAGELSPPMSAKAPDVQPED